MQSGQFESVDGFPREAGAHIDELKIFYPFIPRSNGTMIDVGAHKGESFMRFHNRGWTIYAFEPDPGLYGQLCQKTVNLPRIMLDSRAVFHVSDRELPWHTTPDSTGAGSIHPFSASHVKTGTVSTVTLADTVAQYDIQHLDLLKIDAEGFDFMVLQGFPFELLRPDFIICEFEDAKTVPLGYTTYEMAEKLRKHGYTLYISEWHPIIRYGILHQWHGFRPWPSQLHNARAWGNILAFASPPDEKILLETVKNSILYDSLPVGGKHA